MAMEALSNLLTKPSSRVVAKCLRIIELLLTNPQSRQQLFAPPASPRLPVELMAVLHRVVLTRDSLSLHLASLRVLHLILASAGEKLRASVAGSFPSLLWHSDPSANSYIVFHDGCMFAGVGW